MLQVGVTGGIGSGKTVVCQIFRALGVAVYDADSRAKLLMTEDASLKKSIQKEFGENTYSENGEINRDFLAEAVFNDKEKIKSLNGLVHPAVARDYERWVQEQNSQYVVKEAALLIESGSYLSLDKIIVVQAPLELRVERVKQRDAFRSEDEIMAIISKQLSDNERAALADVIIQNDESQLLVKQVLKAHQRIYKRGN